MKTWVVYTFKVLHRLQVTQIGEYAMTYGDNSQGNSMRSTTEKQIGIDLAFRKTVSWPWKLNSHMGVPNS